MKTKFFIAFIFFFGMTSKCFSQTASFSMDDSLGCGPLCINFSDQSTNALSWSWNFGDAATSTVQNPTHCYTTPGNYTVTLMVTFASSTGTATGNVYVYPSPSAAFAASNIGGNTVSFTDQSVGATTWYWSFGDNSYSTSQNPTHTYAQSGADTACLVVVNSFGCMDSTCNIVAPTGIRNYEATANWDMFPNPSATGKFTIQFDSPSAKTESLVIENVLGEKIIAEEISETTTIDLSNNAAGIYFVRLGNGPAKKLVIGY